jgi:hypothetical protein
VGRLLTPRLADFVDAREPLNASPTGRPASSGACRTNMSVWKSVEALADFTYRTRHRHVMRRRPHGWDEPHMVLSRNTVLVARNHRNTAIGVAEG